MRDDPYELAATAANELARITGTPRHDVAVVLGSGWTDAAAALGTVAVEFPVVDLPGFLPPVAQGHRGTVRSTRLGGVCVLIFSGRTHWYEGHGANAVVHAIRTAAAAGARLAVLTNANGSLHPEWDTGTGVLIRDHLNLSGATPLVGARFVDLVSMWDPQLREWAKQANPALVEGVYAMMAGPQYQTLAETAMLSRVGADVVGMSTVLEAIAAREMQMQLLGLSVVTTREGTEEVINPDEVVRVAALAAGNLGGTIATVIERWASHVQ